MEVMRSNYDVLVTIVEVLLYDPLYTWTLSPEKAALLQKISEDDVSESENVAEIKDGYRGIFH